MCQRVHVPTKILLQPPTSTVMVQWQNAQIAQSVITASSLLFMEISIVSILGQAANQLTGAHFNEKSPVHGPVHSPVHSPQSRFCSVHSQIESAITNRPASL